jgi:hypothetical protein
LAQYQVELVGEVEEDRCLSWEEVILLW